MTVSFKRQSANAGTVIFADAENIAHTLRASVKISPKNILGGGKANNNRFELVDLKPGTLTRGTAQVEEILSVRFAVSGSVDNAAELELMLDEAYAKAKLMIAAGSLKGFVPDMATL